MASRILRFSFYTLFIFTPLFFTRFNNELFEFNKMLLVYGLTVLITGSWIYQMVAEKKLLFKRTPLDLPLFLFFISQILSTIFSIDPHTSIWGYYSRLNGGLLSIAAYLILYWVFVSNFNKSDISRFLKAMVLGGVLVALWAIPEHFGYSPSCAILVGRFAADCWVQDVQARVFATLGQPNWLAAYMGMLLFPAIYLFITEKVLSKKALYYLAAILFYMAFTFTFSRGGMLGVVGGVAVFGVLAFIQSFKHLFSNTSTIPRKESSEFKLASLIIISFILVNLLYGSALTGSFRLIRENAPPPRPAIAGGTQLENGGTESGKIRLIVWRGALEVFKKYPVFGSGVETFAYSYYMYRPVEHNLVSEWDFLYNKAHNEYLNYLATTGTVGFLTYILMIVVFSLWSVLRLFNKQLTFFSSNFRFKLSDSLKSLTSDEYLLIACLLGGYVSYLIQNFFGFSVVMIAVLFYLFPAFAFLTVDEAEQKRGDNLSSTLDYLRSAVLFIYKRNIYTNAVKIVIVLFSAYLFISVINLWRADVFYKIGSDASDTNDASAAYNSLLTAYEINSSEPLYQSDFGNVAASAALALTETDATKAAELKDQSILFTENALSKSPANVSLWRTAIRTYYVLSIMDPQYEGKTIEVIDETIKRAPTDPKLYYNKALILSQQNKNDQAIQNMLEAIKLKPNYREAKISLGDLYIKNKQPEKAIAELNSVLEMIPNDPDAMAKLEEATAESNL